MGSRRGITLSASGLIASIRLVAHRSSITPRAACLSPVAMTILGLVASIVSFSVGQALAKLTGMLTA